MKKKLPPQNLDAEKSVLGAILLDEEALLEIMDIITPKDFYNPVHEIIFEAITKLFESQKAIDVLTLSSFLKQKKKLKTIGGVAYLTELVELVPSAAHIKEYAELVREASIRRKMLSFSTFLQELSYKEDQEIDTILDKAESKFFDLTEDNIKKDFVHVSELLEKSYEKAEELSKNPDSIRGIPSGFKSLDNILGGFQNSDLIIVAARPSVGKTSLALDFVRNIAVKLKKNVGFFSLEMSNLQLMNRLLAMEMGVGLWNLIMWKGLDDDAYPRYSDAMGVLSESGIYIDDTPGLSVLEMRAKARKLKMEKGVDLIVVDYLQLMEGRNKESRVQEVSEISRFLKQLARELDVPVIALSQLSRAVEQRNDKIPQLSDLRESGSIEQDADVVMFIHREELYNPDTDRQGIADLIIAKHRNGPTGKIELFFLKEQASFKEIDKAHSS